MNKFHTRSASFIAIGAASALLLAACNGDSDPGNELDPDAPVTITITTFGTFGLMTCTPSTWSSTRT
jgi:hypothetical protein